MGTAGDDDDDDGDYVDKNDGYNGGNDDVYTVFRAYISLSFF